jgi:hypothetical protein
MVMLNKLYLNLFVIPLKPKREKYNYYINNLLEVDSIKKIGAEKASLQPMQVLERVHS